MMNVTSRAAWPQSLLDPTSKRNHKPRTTGITMVIDKGLGIHAFEDLIQTSGQYIDLIKIGFGTSPLYPQDILMRKIQLAQSSNIGIIPGGTFLEVALVQNAVADYFDMIQYIGFTGIEVSDGTIDMHRNIRNELIQRGVDGGLDVFTEYGKKSWGSRISVQELVETIHYDLEKGALLVTIEGRESGAGVGIFDENGECRVDEIRDVIALIPNPEIILWEAPQKSQQVFMLQTLGPQINLGNIAPQDILSLEALRRGLRSDTLDWGVSCAD